MRFVEKRSAEPRKRLVTIEELLDYATEYEKAAEALRQHVAEVQSRDRGGLDVDGAAIAKRSTNLAAKYLRKVRIALIQAEE